jgi:hypothetical protein
MYSSAKSLLFHYFIFGCSSTALIVIQTWYFKRFYIPNIVTSTTSIESSFFFIALLQIIDARILGITLVLLWIHENKHQRLTGIHIIDETGELGKRLIIRDLLRDYLYNENRPSIELLLVCFGKILQYSLPILTIHYFIGNDSLFSMCLTLFFAPIKMSIFINSAKMENFHRIILCRIA